MFGGRIQLVSPLRTRQTDARSAIAHSIGLPGFLILAAMVIGLIDETIRKALPAAPVEITAIKSALLMLAIPCYRSLAMQASIKTAPWLCWIGFVLFSSLLVFLVAHSPLHFAASLLLYLGMLGSFCAGQYLQLSSSTRSYFTRLAAVGLVVALAVAFAQEFARSSLPLWLTRRVYIASHSLAGGEYCESIFATSTVSAALFFVSGLIASGFFFLDSRRRALAGLVLSTCLTALFFTRIRAVIVLYVICVATMALLPMVLGARRSTARVLTTLVLLAWGVGGLMLLAPSPTNDLSGRYRRDLAYFSRATSAPELIKRGTFGFAESLRVHEQAGFFGYGLGTSGSIRSLINDYQFGAPPTLDTGLYLITVEGGFVGLACFLFLLAMLLYQSRPRPQRDGELDPLAVSTWIAALGMSLWFLLKSHAILENMFCQMLWFGCLGFSLRRSCPAQISRPVKQPPAALRW